MKHLSKVLLVALMVTGCGKDNSSGGSGGVQRNVDPLRDRDGAKNEMLWLLNDHRARRGLPRLQEAFPMSNEALGHSQNMATGRAPFNHFGMSQRCARSRASLGSGNACGEIIASGDVSTEAAFNGWMRSWPHRNQIEDPRYTRVGLGVDVDRAGRPFWTVLFLQL